MAGRKQEELWKRARESVTQNSRFIMNMPPPVNVPMSAMFKQSYACITVLMRMSHIIDMTLDQFKADMEQLLKEEKDKNGEADSREQNKGNSPKTICGTLKIKCNGQQNVNEQQNGIEQPENDEEYQKPRIAKKSIRWICTPPPMSEEEIDMAVNGFKMELQMDDEGQNLEWRPKYCFGTRKDDIKPFECYFGKQKLANRQQNEAVNPQLIFGQDKENELPPCDPRRLKKKGHTVQGNYVASKPAVSEEILEDEDDPRFDEWCNVEKALMQLKDEIQKNKWWPNVRGNAPDVKDWNRFMMARSRQERTPRLRWLCTVWVYADCYLYRRIYETFQLSQTLKTYDPYRTVKIKSFLETMDGMHLAAGDFWKILQRQPRPPPKHEDVANYLRMFLSMSLWGNRPDLMSGGPKSPISDFTGGNPLLRALTFGESVLLNEMEMVGATLADEKLNHRRRVDIVTDNAGFELFADMVLADFLITFRLAAAVHFHVKAMPWNIENATRYDVENTVVMMANSRKKSVPVAKLAERWCDFLRCGTWVVEDDDFWTLPYDYNDMRCYGAPLYCKLLQSSLVIFKGDLNYRKLVGDINWDPDVSFKTALRSFRPTNIMALRVFKSDVSCGIPKFAHLFQPCMSKTWMLSGKFAVAQFAKEKQCVPGLVYPP